MDSLVPSEDVEPVTLHRAMRHSLFAGGKRFRPVFVYAVGKTFGVAFEHLDRVAAAIEMIHTYSLIHDDLPAMDNDDFRRGQPTCHKKFGEATAILAGDALETLAFQALAEDETLSAEVRVRLLAEMAQSAGTPRGMVSGQEVDLESEGEKITPAELEGIHREKTGAMIEFSARSAVIIAKGTVIELEAITAFAGYVGLLFQITDDLLDVTQTSEVLGKTAGKDEAAAKATYPSFFGIEGTRQLAVKTYEQAIGALNGVNKDVMLLHDIVEYILRRTS